MRRSLCLVISLLGCSSEQRLADRTKPPLQAASQAEVVAKFELPPMHVTISPEGRIFMDALARDPESSVKTIELKAGAMVPFPAPELQHKFTTIHGLSADRRGRLWILDPGNYAFSHRPRIYGYDIDSGKEIEDYAFPAAVAPLGSMLNDVVMDEKRDIVWISDTGSLIRDSALIEFNIPQRRSRRALAGHPSVSPGTFDIVVEGQPFRVWRVIRPKYGVDGLAIDPSGTWLYYSPLNQGALYRIPLLRLADPTLAERSLAEHSERVAETTMSDGMLFDRQGRLYLSDIEHSAVVRLTPDGRLETILKDPRFRWPISFALAPGGQIYFTCGSIDRVQRATRSEQLAVGPYYLYRFQPDP